MNTHETKDKPTKVKINKCITSVNGNADNVIVLNNCIVMFNTDLNPSFQKAHTEFFLFLACAE